MVGAFLLLLMVTVLAGNALVFSARSFQQNFTAVTGAPVFSARQVDDIARAMAVVEDRLEPLKISAARIEQKIAEKQSSLDLARREAEAAKEAGGAPAAAEPPVASAAPALDTPSITPPAAVNTLVSPADQGDQELQALQAQSLVINQQIDTTRNELIASNALLRSGFQGNFNQVRAEVDSLRATSPLGIGMWLAQVHPSSLSTLLAVLMGALGAMLFLFPAYVANKPEWEVTFAAIIVRMVFGMVTAFAFYILANSAIAAFALGGGGDAKSATAENLNPFTVAGLGVIAGIMADDIALWIHKRGKDMFSNNAEQARETLSDVGQTGAGVNIHGGPNDPA
jgi:hypothetical protein